MSKEKEVQSRSLVLPYTVVHDGDIMVTQAFIDLLIKELNKRK